MSERMKSPRARLFVALDLPAGTRSEIERWGADSLADPALRRVASESLHVTLAFLGSRPESEIERIAAIVEATEALAVPISFRDPIARPERGAPRLFALPVDSPEAVTLQSDLAARLVAEGFYEAEKRPFWPHLTIARVRPEGRGSRRPKGVVEPPGPLPEAIRRTHVRAVRTSLYRSELKPQGAMYTPLAHVDLPDPGQQ